MMIAFGLHHNVVYADEPTCSPGSYMNNGTCENCPVGYKCSGDDMAEQCAGANIASEIGQTDCEACSDGTYSNTSHTQCVACDGNLEYVDGGVCKTCSGANEIVNDDNNGCICKDRYYPYRADENSNTFECKICDAGYYCQNNVQKLCGEGTYSGTGQKSCTDCPVGYTTDTTGAVSISACKKIPVKLDIGSSDWELPNCLVAGDINASVVRKVSETEN